MAEEKKIYVKNDFLVTFVVNKDEDISECDIRVGYLSPASNSVKFDTPTEIDTEANMVHYAVSKSINLLPGTWKFWIEDTNTDQLVADSTEIVVKVYKH